MSYFQKKVISSKCAKCPMHKVCDKRLDSNILYTSGRPELLIILSKPETDFYMSLFLDYLSRKDITNYVIKSGVGCTVKTPELPTPLYKNYKHCNIIKEDEVKYKAIMTVGSGLYAITQNSDIVSWGDFAEFLFNPTYFLTGFKWKRKLKVYPIPDLKEWLELDNFEKFFSNKQLGYIKEEIKTFNEDNVTFKPYKKVIVDDPNAFLRENMHECSMGIDTETTGLNVHAEGFKCRTVTISFDGEIGYYLEFDKINRRLLSKFLSNKKQWYSNGKYDWKVFEKMGVKNSKVAEDPSILYHILSTVRTLNGLKTAAWFVGFGGYEDELDDYWHENKGITWATIPHTALHNYATLDAIVTHRVTEHALKLAEKQPKILENYYKLLIPTIEVFKDMEMVGMEIDVPYLNSLHDKLVTEKKDLTKQIKLQLDIDNISSSAQMGKALELMGWPCHGRGKNIWYDVKGEPHNLYKVGDPQLSLWKKEGYELAELIHTFKAIDKLDSAFVGATVDEEEIIAKRKSIGFFEAKREDFEDEALIGLAKSLSNGNRVYSNFNVARTSTWRGSSSGVGDGTGVNLQQMPKQGAGGKRFRPVFKCPDDYLLAEIDYSGFQLRIAALLSGDETLSNVFMTGNKDAHSITAQGVFARDVAIEKFLEYIEEETQPYKTYRYRAKQINFGFIFCRSAIGFKPDLENSWTDDEIDEYIKDNDLVLVNDYKSKEPDPYLTVSTDIRKKFFETYPKITPWVESKQAFAKDHGYLDSYHGIRRHLPQMLYSGKDVDRFKASSYNNIASNSDVQAFEAFELYTSMIKIHEYIKTNNRKTQVVATVHDSVVCYIHKDEIEEMTKFIKNTMDNQDYPVNIEVDVELGKVWGFGSKVDFNNFEESIVKIKEKYKR